MTHLSIIKQAGGVASVHRALGLPRERVAAWKRQESIPAQYWEACERAGIASVADLARTVPPRKARKPRRPAPSPTTHEAA